MSTSIPSSAKDFERAFFTLTVEEAQKLGPYDIIIVGTGIGGGVLARDIFETNSRIGNLAKSVLVIEKGGLVFHSHCLNASRPEGLGKDRGQQNDSFFALFKEDYGITHVGDTSPKGGIPPSKWKGGPMHNIGGRSAAWGLFAPRVHDTTLAAEFPPKIFKELKDTYYEKTEKLFNLSLPTSKIVHQHLIERLNIQTDSDYHVNWHWGRIASEFKDDRNFDFAEGAYSTIDKLLEIMMSKPTGRNRQPEEHQNFKMLVRTEVRKVILNSNKVVTGVVVAPSNGGAEQTIKLRHGGRVILAAGSVASPSILLRSGISLGDKAGHLTDHDILYRSLSFRYLKPNYRQEVGPMKLQTYFHIGLKHGEHGLANMSIDASSFLPRGDVTDKSLPQLIMAFILPCPLEKKNSVTLIDDEPKVNIIRTQFYDEDERKRYLERMKAVTDSAFNVIKEHLKVEFVNDKKDGDFLSYLELGGVAHELGTLPMPNRTEDGVIDEDLKLNGYEGIYVCDLSIFPMSPEANPTLTLAALAIRLSRTLVVRERVPPIQPDMIWVVNHSGETVKVWVSNYAGVEASKDNLDAHVLYAGEEICAFRKAGVQEAVMVFKWDKSADAERSDPKSPTFSTEPELFVGYPGRSAVVIS